jgi:hypothetical protein
LSDTADIVLAANTITLTNKTLTAPIIGGDVTTASGNLQLNAATNIVEVKGDGSATEGQIILNCETNAHGQTIKPQPHSAAVTNTMLLPAGADSTLVSEVATQTLTNKSLTSPTITGTGAIAGVFTGNITGDVTSGNIDGKHSCRWFIYHCKYKCTFPSSSSCRYNCKRCCNYISCRWYGCILDCNK